MNVIYSDGYNIDLGLLNYLHPFEGCKFREIFRQIENCPAIKLFTPGAPIEMELVDEFVSSLMSRMLRERVFIFRAIEVPKLPFISFSYLDKKILTPMRWGVAGTLLGAEKALQTRDIYWNLSGGYHHASPQSMEGFCIYNDIGITHQQLLKSGQLKDIDKILIIDTDAHHGNGNAYTFLKNDRVTLLDVYNEAIYPTSPVSRRRVNIPVPLQPGTEGSVYLEQYGQALAELENDFALAFVVAGTDVLYSDKLGRLGLTIDDVVEREKMTVSALQRLGIPAVILGGGGYSKDSAKAVSKAIQTCANEFS